MKSNKYKVKANNKFDIRSFPTNAKADEVKKSEIKELFKENLKIMAEEQEKLYAAEKEGLIVVIQALDAAGKDSTIKKVMRGFNPAGINVHNFKSPSENELAHDYLWRVHACVPRKGEIAIFNRSHYEDVISVPVRKYYENYQWADRINEQSSEDIFKARYRQINNFEQYLYENSYRMVKIFLNISKAEQKERFLERINRPEKHWKFGAGDVHDRALFDDYLDTIEEVISKTSTKNSPWYIIPADQKWYTRYLVSEILYNTLKDMKPQFPTVSESDIKSMAESKILLEQE